VLAAASPALNREGEGSSPSGPTDMHWSSSGQDSAPVMRIRRFESGPVLSTSIRCGGSRVGTGGWLLTASSQVRFLLPQPGRSSRIDFSGIG
jgi:hypothetical protein